MPRVKAATPREAPELLLQVAAALGDIVVKHVPATCMPEKSEQRGSLPLECLVAYLAYAATVLEVLRAQTNAHSWRSLENCEVDRLARVRQLLSADPGIAVEILAQLRERLALSALPRAVLGVGLSASEPAVPTFGVPAAGDVSVADTDHPANARQLGR